MEEHQEGTGVLTHRLFPDIKLNVEFSITFRFQVQAMPKNPRVLTKLPNVVHYVRSKDGRDISDGEYNLHRQSGGSSEFIYLRRWNGYWETLPM